MMAGSGNAHLRVSSDLCLSATSLDIEYGSRRGRALRAVADVSLDIKRSETLGLVGESGCGKSTLVRGISRLVPVAGGQVQLNGVDLTSLSGRRLRKMRPQLQLVFQDPASSLNPYRRVREIVAEPLRVWPQAVTGDMKTQVSEALSSVGLDIEEVGDRFPREFSGGQLQRICIARALILRPELLICDEPVSALDVSVQAQILNLLVELQRTHALALLFVSHDLAVIKNVSDRVAVMYLGKLCEVAAADALFTRPAHPYTKALIESAPRTDARRGTVLASISGEVPSPVEPPSGCRFRTRCPRASELCSRHEPVMQEIGPEQYVACHHPLLDWSDEVPGTTAVTTSPAKE